MGVRKFRSVADMPGPTPLRPLAPQNLKLAFGLSSFAGRLSPLRLSPGVRKFRSWDEALAAREARRNLPTRDGQSPSSGAISLPASKKA